MQTISTIPSNRAGELFNEFREIHSRSLVDVEEQINAQKLHSGDLVYLYYSPSGEYGLTRHSRKSLTKEFLKNAMIWAFLVFIVVYGSKYRYGSKYPYGSRR